MNNIENIKIRETYSKPEFISEMKNFFENEAFIQLNQFFEIDLIPIKNKLSKENFKLKYDPMKFKFKELEFKGIYDLELIKFIEFFRSKNFLIFIENIVGFEINFKNISINKYSHKDFTILNDEMIDTEDLIEVIFDLSDEFEDNMGGLLTYTTKKEEVFYLNPAFNTLTIMYKPSEVMKYLKYINNLSKGKEMIRFNIQFEIMEEY